jgi:phosphoribosylaminoimidazole-succinocarboxamide synthase
MQTITSTSIPGLKLHSRGKVRDTYDLGNSLLMVATDRLSAFDVVFNEGIPKKGAVLTQLTLFWLQKLSNIIPNHLITAEVPKGLPDWLKHRSMVVKKAEIFPLECVVRGYLAGSGWKEYQKSQSVCGISLPAGLQNASKLPTPIFTPSTKASVGHDINVTGKEAEKIIGSMDMFNQLQDYTLRLYSAASEYAQTRGIILADTKFEFGFSEGKIILADEALTPDSSRYWPADKYSPGKEQESFDKQFVRNYLESIGWNKTPPPPKLPDDVIAKTTEKYVQAYEKITGKKFEFE